jgi:16S rRNA (guanine1207-N2)-methyltransferase
VRLTLPDLTLDLATDRGVFAREAIDPGTKLLLLEAPAPPSAGNLLDLGCGYGPIALTLAKRRPEAVIWAVDVNRRALALVEANVATAGLSNVRVAAPADVPDDVSFDAIWSNPPIRIGKEALHALLVLWLGRLTPSGAATLVVQRHLGADSLVEWLRGQGWAVERLRSRMSYRLLEVKGA